MPAFLKPSKVKKPTRKKIILELDEIIRRIVRFRDTHCCSCGKNLEEGAQVSHYVTRRVYALRWNLNNCHMSCPGCNMRHNYDPIPYTLFMIRTYGKEKLDELATIKNSVKKMSSKQLSDLLAELTEYYSKKL